MTKRYFRACVWLLLLVGTATTLADTATYEYDALGRLARVRYTNGTVVVYRLDAAGNRTQVINGTLPGTPASISVPSSSTTGSYSIGWGAATGTVTAYKLYEATNSSFSGQVLVYTGTALTTALSGRGNGTYYYRVRVCFDDLCSGYRAGANGISVLLPPGVPASISVPSSSGPSYTISWGAASGSSPSYQLYEATNASFTGQVQVFSGTGQSFNASGKGAGTYYYRVRACNGSGCSAYRTGSNGVTVIIPIQTLNPSIQVGATGQLTQITTLANLNGNTATIQSFSPSCAKAGAAIQSGAQSVRWTNSNTFLRGCEIGVSEQCSASYVIRNSANGALHSGTASITVVAQGVNLPPGHQCP